MVAHIAASAPVLDALLPSIRPRVKNAAHTPSAPLQLSSGFPGDVVKATLPSANDGSPEAMRELATGLHACAEANMASDDEIERLVARRSLGRQLLSKNARIVSPADDAAEVKRLEDIRDSCVTVSPDATKQWLDWLEKAAATGDADSRFQYAWEALEEFPTQASREENAEEYLRRRDLAFGLLQDSVANGDCSSGILNGFRKVSPDPLTRYVYEGLLLQHALDYYSTASLPPDVVNSESQGVQAALTNLSISVPVEQRGLAQATIRNILQNYCTQF
jgi:hypothetical protein